MASSAPAVVAATDFLMILLSPKRHLEKEKREVSRTREAQALLSSHRNMNYNIRPVADSRSLHRGTGEPAGSTSQQFLPDCSAELWRTYHKDSPQPATAAGSKQASRSSLPAYSCPTAQQAGWRPAAQRWPPHSPGTQHCCDVQVLRPPGCGPKAKHAIAATRQPMLIFFSTVRPTDRPSPPNTSDTHG
jgi:hypothetical protein